ncbi:hypothetical protein PWT90_06881 [Aphanocladium album]|nr:hypothetical protein PWT90_06881 [Aphanocladium album]
MINNLKRKGKPGALALVSWVRGSVFRASFQSFRCIVARPLAQAGQRFVIDGSSKYHEVRLDKWEAHRHKNHVLKLGFQKSSLGWKVWRPCQTLTDNFEQLWRHKNDWETAQGYVAAIYRLLVGTTEFVAGISITADGFYAKYAFGHHAAEIGRAGNEMTEIATAAGPAVELGVNAAAAVYFIPWTDVVSWLKGAVWWMWGKVQDIWDTFVSLLKRFFRFRIEVNISPTVF